MLFVIGFRYAEELVDYEDIDGGGSEKSWNIAELKTDKFSQILLRILHKNGRHKRQQRTIIRSLIFHVHVTGRKRRPTLKRNP